MLFEQVVWLRQKGKDPGRRGRLTNHNGGRNIKLVKLTRRVGGSSQTGKHTFAIMSFLPRRALLRSYPAARSYSDTAIEQAKAKWLANQAAIEHHALCTLLDNPHSSIQLIELQQLPISGAK
jgi:hypothetical protein